MNQPTWEDFHRLENELREEMRKLREQITEPIKPINVNVGSADVLTRLDELEQKIDTTQEDANRVKIQMEGARADISNIKANQSDHGEYFKEDRQIQSQHAEKLDQHTEVLGQLVTFAESHDALLKTTATKDDLAALRDEQGQKLDLILKLLQQKP
jgi:hypothetical protein